MAGELRITAANAYVEGSEDPRLVVTAVAAYAELKQAPELRSTEVAAYFELLYQPLTHRTDVLAPFEVRRQYLSLLNLQGVDGAWILINQGRMVTPVVEWNVDQVGRLGDVALANTPGDGAHSMTVELYADDDLDELGRALGMTRSLSGWVGSEQIALDPTVIVNWRIDNYDGVEPDSVLLFREYVNHFQPTTMEMALATDEVRIVAINGVAGAYYIIPEAGL
jgi:hypothetical protein